MKKTLTGSVLTKKNYEEPFIECVQISNDFSLYNDQLSGELGVDSDNPDGW